VDVKSIGLLVMMLGVTTWLGCGSVDDENGDGGAGMIDAPDAREAPPDAAPATTALDLTSAAGRMQGGTLTLDFEIGHAIDQGSATGGAFTLEAGATLPP
jgi:hypothetical protein